MTGSCDDPLRRVLSRLDPDKLTQCFISWSEVLSDLSGGDIVSIDGKTLRHSFDTFRYSFDHAASIISAR